MVEGYCRWKLSSGNLYTFIRPNQEQLRKIEASCRALTTSSCKMVSSKIIVKFDYAVNFTTLFCLFLLEQQHQELEVLREEERTNYMKPVS
jgi:hypothetical protein